MTCELTVDESSGVLELLLEGVVSGEELREVTRQGIAQSRHFDRVRCLIDATNQDQTGTISDLYDMPGLYADGGLDHQARIALVIPIRQELHELATFYETVCVNRAWQVKLFRTRTEALDWLLETD